MTDREKLIGFLKEIAHENCFGSTEKIADHLIAHGVTVKEMQKPLTLEEAIEMSKDEHAIFYLEDNLKNSIIHSEDWGSVNFWLNKCVEKSKHRNSYGRYWRCWAKRPTEEERKNAKWEE